MLEEKRKTVTLDIDGVLNNYPTCWLDYIELEQKKRFLTIADAKKELGQDVYSEIKEKYRTSGYKSMLPVNPIAPAFTKLLKEKGYKIIIATSRPFDSYEGLRKLTFDWLVNNEITFDFLEKKNETLLSNYGPLFHVDDELDHVHFFLEKKVKVFIVKRADVYYEDFEKYETLVFVDSLADVIDHIS